ncbi:MAG: LuxR C-terminal-related transcriptional regulator [Actinomycetota bacterium]
MTSVRMTTAGNVAAARESVYAEVDDWRLRPPQPLARNVRRFRLVEPLVAPETRVVVISAPAGYGKSTVLRQWSEDDPRPFLWLNCDASDADTVLFARRVAVAVDRQAPLEDDLTLALAGLVEPSREVHRLVAQVLGNVPESFVLVLDDVHHLAHTSAESLVADIERALPTGAVLALSGRSRPDLPLGRLRVDGRLREVGPDDLALSRNEAQALLRSRGLEIAEPALDELYQATEGWVAGLQLMTLAQAGTSSYLTEPASDRSRSRSLRQGDRFLAEYVREEVFTAIEPKVLSFLMETSVLDNLDGDMCDEVLRRTGSAELLEQLAATRRLFLTPTDTRRHGYRMHRLFAGLLQDELRRTRPDRFRELHLAASDWCENQGDIDAAISHAVAAQAADRAGDLVLANATRYVGRGRCQTVGRWLDEVGPRWTRQTASMAMGAALHAVATADMSALAEHLAVLRTLRETGRLADGTPSVAVAVAVVEALAGQFPIDQMTRRTNVIRDAGRQGNPWYALAIGMQGQSQLLMGDIAGGRALLLEALADLEVAHLRALVFANLALGDIAEGDWEGAEIHVAEACSIARANDLERLPMLVLVSAVAAWVQAHAGHVDQAHAYAAEAATVLAALNDAKGFVNRLLVLVPTCLAQSHLCLGELDVARVLHRVATEASVLEPSASLVLRLVDRLGVELEEATRSRLTGESPTVAERRVLELLPTHAPLQQIAETLFVSRNTVKSHTLSIYRKLDVSSRSDAVTKARALGLLRRGA